MLSTVIFCCSTLMQSVPLRDMPLPSPPDAPQLESPAPSSSSARFKVKRWAGKGYRGTPSSTSSASKFAPPTPKCPSLPAPPMCDRWSGGFLASGYRPSLSWGSDNLPPPVFPPRPFSGHGVVGGLHHIPPGLGIHRPGMRPLESLPVRPQTLPVEPAGSPTTMQSVAVESLAPVSGVHPSGVSAQTLNALHDQLKSQHFKSWLSLIEEAGSSSRLFRDTVESQLMSEHRIKAIAQPSGRPLLFAIKPHRIALLCLVGGGFFTCPLIFKRSRFGSRIPQSFV